MRSLLYLRKELKTKRALRKCPTDKKRKICAQRKLDEKFQSDFENEGFREGPTDTKMVDETSLISIPNSDYCINRMESDF